MELECRCRGRAEQHRARDACGDIRRQAVDEKRESISPERIADQDDLADIPALRVVVDDAGEIGRGLVWRTSLPVVAQAAPADAWNASPCQSFSDGLVQVCPSAITGQNDRHRAGMRR